jgi:hypothetical protein
VHLLCFAQIESLCLAYRSLHCKAGLESGHG